MNQLTKQIISGRTAHRLSPRSLIFVVQLSSRYFLIIAQIRFSSLN
jgi:hypothetical protein